MAQPMPTPNYVNPEVKGYSILVLSAVLGPLALLTVVARFWARSIILRRTGWDDYIAFLALALAIAFTALVNVVSYKYHIIRHSWDIVPTDRVHIAYYLWWTSHIYMATTAAIKVSILLFYERVLARSSGRAFHWINVSLICFVLAYSIGVILSVTFYCRPVRSFWMGYSPQYVAENDSKCVGKFVHLPIAAVLSAATDLAVVILPLFFLHKLKISRRQKWGLRALFSLGFLICAAAAVRTYFMFKLHSYPADRSWSLYDAIFFSTIEIFIAIICASAPALKPIFNLYLKDPMNSLRSRYGKASRAHGSERTPQHYQIPVMRRKDKHSSGLSTFDKDLEIQAATTDTAVYNSWDGRAACSQTELQVPGRVMKSVSYGVAYEEKQ